MKGPYSLPQHADQILLEWSAELAEHFGAAKETLSALDIPHGTLHVDLMDGSHVEFKRGLAIVSERRRAIAVFTEHCGYPVFPLHDSKVFRDGVVVYKDEARKFREDEPEAGR